MLSAVTALPAAAQTPATQPASAPATSPAEPAFIRVEPLPGGDDPLTKIEAALTLNEVEKQAMIDAAASPTSLDEAAFPMMLAKVAALPELDDKSFGELDRPAVKSLLKTPERYSLAPMVLKVMVFQVRRCEAEKDFAGSIAWPREKPLWRLNCTSSVPKTARQEQDPLIVFSTVDPTRWLGKSKEGGEEGELRYPDGPTLELAGVFYKIRRTAERQSGELRDYPVVLAWQVRPSREWFSQSVGDIRVLIPLLIILILAFVFVFLRRRVSRRGVGAGRIKYQSRRDQTAEPGAQPDNNFAAPEEPPAPVDPLLVAAAEEYRKAHPEEFEQDDAHGKDRQG